MKGKTDKIPAKLCYEHVGGKLGNLLLKQFVANGWLAKETPEDKNFYVTEKGIIEFEKIGIDVAQINT